MGTLSLVDAIKALGALAVAILQALRLWKQHRSKEWYAHFQALVARIESAKTDEERMVLVRALDDFSNTDTDPVLPVDPSKPTN